MIESLNAFTLKLDREITVKSFFYLFIFLLIFFFREIFYGLDPKIADFEKYLIAANFRRALA